MLGQFSVCVEQGLRKFCSGGVFVVGSDLDFFERICKFVRTARSTGLRCFELERAVCGGLHFIAHLADIRVYQPDVLRKPQCFRCRDSQGITNSDDNLRRIIIFFERHESCNHRFKRINVVLLLDSQVFKTLEIFVSTVVCINESLILFFHGLAHLSARRFRLGNVLCDLVHAGRLRLGELVRADSHFVEGYSNLTKRLFHFLICFCCVAGFNKFSYFLLRRLADIIIKCRNVGANGLFDIVIFSCERFKLLLCQFDRTDICATTRQIYAAFALLILGNISCIRDGCCNVRRKCLFSCSIRLIFPEFKKIFIRIYRLLKLFFFLPPFLPSFCVRSLVELIEFFLCFRQIGRCFFYLFR